MMVCFRGDMANVRINPAVISWALRRSGASLESLITPKISLDKLKSWEKGVLPSEGDAKVLADRLGIAYPMLFMKELPPDTPLDIPDRRTVDARPLRNPSVNLLDVLDSSRARQEWYRSELISPAAGKLNFVGKFSSAHASTKIIAEDMRTVLGIDAEARATTSKFEDFLKLLVLKAENVGILVMRSSIVGHATSRKLKVEEFRGFVLIDPFVPLIFINDNDAKAAQIFTFAHELAHIWLGAAGISDRRPDDKENSKNTIETLCDKIATEFLVPESEFSNLWSSSYPLDRNMNDASRHFRVSTLVVLRRARELNRITSQAFFDKVHEQYERYRQTEADKRKREDKKKSGGNFWATFELRSGAKFNAAVAESVRRQRTTYAEAGALFGVAPLTVGRYLDHLGVHR
jgi:Zn-dependent peptidase ImmA (M78 family)